MDVQITQKPALRVAALRHVGPYHGIGEAFMRLDRIVRESGLLTSGAQLIALYHDDPRKTPPDQLRSDAGITVAPDQRLPGELTEQHVQAGTYACTLHIGPYEKLGDAWATLAGQWLPSSGHEQRSGPNLEIYLNTPGNEPDKSKLRTEVCLPIKDRQ